MLLTLLIARLASATSDTIPFSSGEIAIRGGVLVPIGSLSDLFAPAPRAGASLVMAHWGHVLSRLDLDYAHLDGAEPLHYVHGAAGFEWRPGPLELGASLALLYVKNTPDPDDPRLSDGGETEFGFDVRASAPFWRSGPWTARLEARWEEALTSPNASALANFGFSLSRSAW